MINYPFNIGADPQGFLCAVGLPIFLVKWLLVVAGSIHEQSATGKQIVPLARHFAHADLPGDEEQVIRSAKHVVLEAGRCIELENHCNYRDLVSMAIGVSEVMSHIYQRIPTGHVSLFGKAFGLYATMLQDRGRCLDHEPVVDPPTDTVLDVARHTTESSVRAVRQTFILEN